MNIYKVSISTARRAYPV